VVKWVLQNCDSSCILCNFVMVWTLTDPQNSCVEGLVSRYYWKVAETFRKWGLVEGSRVIGTYLWRGFGGSSLSFLSTLLPGSHESNTMMFWLTTGPKNGLKPWVKIILSSFFPQNFITMKESWVAQTSFMWHSEKVKLRTVVAWGWKVAKWINFKE
jgi:hypothetical protein